MNKSCQELVCVAVEESGRKGFLEEMGAEAKRGRHPRVGGEQVPGFQGRKVAKLSKARCRFGSDI